MFESAFYLRGFRYETATLVEHAAVNRSVVGSSPTGGAKNNPVNACIYGFSVTRNKNKNALKKGNIVHMAAKATV